MAAGFRIWKLSQNEICRKTWPYYGLSSLAKITEIPGENEMNEQASHPDDYTAALERTSSDWAEFVPQARALVTAGVALADVRIGRKSNLGRMSIYLNERLSKLKNVSSLEYIDFLQDMHGEGKPLNGVDIQIFATVLNLEQLGALYYFQQHGFPKMDLRSESYIQTSVAKIAFEQGPRWAQLNTILDVIDAARPGFKLAEGVADLLANLDLHVTLKDVTDLQRLGGVERIKAVGADLAKICTAVFEDIQASKISPKEVLSIHQFMKDSTNELVRSGVLSKDLANFRYSHMVIGVLKRWRKGTTGADRENYRTTVMELMPHLNPQIGSSVIPRMTKVLSAEEIKSMIKDPRAVLEPKLFLQMLKKHVAEEQRYDLVKALGVDDLFSPSELNALKGKKLEAALGL
jgi:hypothetical protein